MYSINFPEMVSGGRTFIAKDHEATINNLKLILKTCTRNTLFGDPYYGNNLLSVIFRPNNVLVEDLVKDEIYTCIKNYIPQLSLTRQDIELSFENNILYANITALNNLTQKLDTYSIDLTTIETE